MKQIRNLIQKEYESKALTGLGVNKEVGRLFLRWDVKEIKTFM